MVVVAAAMAVEVAVVEAVAMEATEEIGAREELQA